MDGGDRDRPEHEEGAEAPRLLDQALELGDGHVGRPHDREPGGREEVEHAVEVIRAAGRVHRQDVPEVATEVLQPEGNHAARIDNHGASWDL